ncbi:50S ribosomal protein L20 [Planctomicrobium sp. SH668]|uniref:50S ribosomal protein L20 n=1 Tax=Planctomicrobium sp. SH668 TaxID=3448126 RepID=UPI003F5B1374
MRVSYGQARRKKKNRIFREARGFWGGRSRLWRTVAENIIRARVYAFRDRRAKKRDFRSLWITRINAACMIRGLRYSEFIHGLTLAGITVNRKMLSELAILEPAVFDEIVNAAKGALAQKA